MAVMTSSSLSMDQRKFLAEKLLRNTYLKLVCASVCNSQMFERGAGATGYFVRYKRMIVPVATIGEGQDPTPSSFTIDQVTLTLDQWGDALQITDVAKLTTKHPVMQLANKLLADNAQRVIDREVQVVWLAGTTIIYGDGTAVTRATVTKQMKFTDDTLDKAYVTLGTAGAQPRGASGGTDNYKVGETGAPSTLKGPQAYIGITDVNVTTDIRKAAAAYGGWPATMTYAKPDAIMNCEIGMWRGVRWIETNFIPVLQLLGNTTTAVVTGNAFGTNTPVVTAVASGGALADAFTLKFKATRKDLLRGFEEFISIEHSMTGASGGGINSFTFNFTGLTAGFVYNLYVGNTTGDANLKQFATTNIAVGTTVTMTAASASTVTAPANLRNVLDGDDPTSLHIVYIHGEESCIWSDLQDLEFMVTENKAAPGNLLALNQWVSYKFMAKAMRCNEDFLLRIEVPTTY